MFLAVLTYKLSFSRVKNIKISDNVFFNFICELFGFFFFFFFFMGKYSLVYK
jgi:hypothetical protein